MGTTSRSVLAATATFLTALAVTLAVCAAFGVEDARAGCGAVVWKKTLDPTARGDTLWMSARAPGGATYACGTCGWVSGSTTGIDI